MGAYTISNGTDPLYVMHTTIRKRNNFQSGHQILLLSDRRLYHRKCLEGNDAVDTSFRFICQSIITIGLHFRKKSVAVIKCALFGMRCFQLHAKQL